jgi:HK97 gp10 family phage protein
MATQGKFELKGLEKYLETLAEAGQNVDASATRAVEAGSEVAQAGMVRRVPVDTGNLRDHIRIKGPEQDGNFISAEVGVIHSAGFTDADTARYGNAQEYGTAEMAAQPYIRPALDEDKGKIRKVMRESLEKDGKL